MGRLKSLQGANVRVILFPAGGLFQLTCRHCWGRNVHHWDCLHPGQESVVTCEDKAHLHPGESAGTRSSPGVGLLKALWVL